MYNQQSKRLVLGEGETIGHKHVLEAASGMEFAVLDESIAFLLHGTGVFTHDEHDRMVLQPDKYRRYHQVQVNPLDNKVYRVFD